MGKEGRGMSGGSLFDYTWPNLEEADGKWRDEEMNELYHDLFCGGDFAVRDYGGLSQSLDFYLSGDVSEECYRKHLAAFKAKWFGRTPESRVGFYQGKLQEACDRYKSELCDYGDERYADGYKAGAMEAL